MAQALLNNLNNTMCDDMFSINGEQDVTSEINFASILDTKIPQTTQNSLSNDTSVEDDATSDKEDELNLTAFITYTPDILMEIQEEVITNIEDSISTDTITNTEDNENAKEQEEDAITEEKTNTTNENTITNEDSTIMNKQLKSTLENPTTAFMLQSQQTEQKWLQAKNSEETEITDEAAFAKQNLQVKTQENQVIKASFAETSKEIMSKTDVKKGKSLTDVIDENIAEELNIKSVSTSSQESETSAGDFMQYQTPQEQAVKVMLHGDTKFENIKILSEQKLATEASPARILEQISKQIEGMHNSSRVNIVLNPENLGKVALKIINTKEGLSAQFTVTTQQTHDILLKGLAGLKESLLAQGINVDNVSVNLNENESGDNEYNQDWTEQDNSNGSNNGHGFKKKKQDDKNFEQTMFEIENTNLG